MQQPVPTLFLAVRAAAVPPGRRAGSRSSPSHHRQLVVEYWSDTTRLTGVVTRECLGVIGALLAADLPGLVEQGRLEPLSDLLVAARMLDPVA